MLHYVGGPVFCQRDSYDGIKVKYLTGFDL